MSDIDEALKFLPSVPTDRVTGHDEVAEALTFVPRQPVRQQPSLGTSPSFAASEVPQNLDAPAMDLPSVEDTERPWFESFREGMRPENVTQSATEALHGLVQPIIHPVKTGQDVYGIASGLVEKLVPGEQKHEIMADAVGEYLKDKYGSTAGIKKAMERDMVGVFLDVSAILNTTGTAARAAGWGAKMLSATKVGGAMQRGGVALSRAGDLMNPMIAGAEGAKVIMAPATKPFARKLYRSALKPTTVKRPEQLEKVVESGLIHGIPTDVKGARLANEKIIDLERKIDDLIVSHSGAGGKIDMNRVEFALRDWAVNVVDPRGKAFTDDWLAAADKVIKKFRKKKGNFLTIEQAHEAKRDLYDILVASFESKRRITSNLAGGAPKYRAMMGQQIAKSIKEEIEVLIPEIKGMNWAQGELIELRQEVARAANRIANRDVFGMGDFLGTGVGGHLAGWKGALIGLSTRQILTRPSISSRFAIRLYRDRVTPWVTTPARAGARAQALGLPDEIEKLRSLEDMRQQDAATQ